MHPTPPAVDFPQIPESAPFTAEQRAWLNGFLAGLFSRGVPTTAVAPAAATSPALSPLTILYGSQTGTSESLAKQAAKIAAGRGFAPAVVDMAEIDLGRLAGEGNVLVITSTYGEGEPPDNARALHAALDAEDAPTLPNLRFSVCSLGDTNYVQFCQCGKDFDARLEKRGAIRIAPRADCDLDYEKAFVGWLDQALSALAPVAPGPKILAGPSPLPTGERLEAGAPAWSKKNPFGAPVIAVRRLNAPDSAKEVNHVELSLEGSGLTYEAGDALGILPQNCPQLVGEVLAELGCDGEEAVSTPDGAAAPLRLVLAEHCCLGRPSAELLALCGLSAAVAASSPGAGVPTNGAPFDVLDALRMTGGRKPDPTGFVRSLRRLQPRLYSIASSPKAHPGQVHLTVGAVRYETNGRSRKGVCSTFLAERALAAGRAGVFVHANRAFRPPVQGDVPMIMVGPGTGIAPFRAFLAERRATGARGRNWLFFGDQRAATDFLYREELEAWRAEGLLTRLDTAFSRDQAEKVYVQHRMREHAAEFFAWLEAGAHVYVCGDASRMAKDVDAALQEIVVSAGGRSPAQAAEYVRGLQASKRYARDVY